MLFQYFWLLVLIKFDTLSHAPERDRMAGVQVWRGPILVLTNSRQSSSTSDLITHPFEMCTSLVFILSGFGFKVSKPIFFSTGHICMKIVIFIIGHICLKKDIFITGYICLKIDNFHVRVHLLEDRCFYHRVHLLEDRYFYHRVYFYRRVYFVAAKRTMSL